MLNATSFISEHRMDTFITATLGDNGVGSGHRVRGHRLRRIGPQELAVQLQHWTLEVDDLRQELKQAPFFRGRAGGEGRDGG